MYYPFGIPGWMAFYSGLIHRNKNWEYAGVYADEAFSGTKENRLEFMRLIADCESGKIDIVLTKSLSRFARNTVTTLKTVRLLKEHGVEVFFEKKDFYTAKIPINAVNTALFKGSWYLVGV